MSTDEQATRASGSVPNAYGNALAWRWSREMPTALRRGFLTLLYALRAMANANGELRFPDGPIRIQDIAKAAGSNEKDTRRYLNAGIAAGVVAVKGEQKRGKATLYTLVLCPMPDWGAAENSLKSTRRPPAKDPAPWQDGGESSGLRDPNQFGPPRPELSEESGEEVRVPATRMSSGPRDPIGSGPRDPNNPGSTQEISQDGAEVVFKPQVVGASGPQKIDSAQHQDHDTARPVGFLRCSRCHERLIPDPRRPERTTHSHCTERTAS
ncbi:hypothetical protein ACFUJR_00930 [Streptomyces sp. NPDC057271]|uniref:hypothetical protein n=1 Tax=unclassified Streptomyces TaxID=2593676 RepID=UPI00363E4340